MAQSNFQDLVVLNQNTIAIGADQLVVGSSAGSKSIVFAQDPALASALYLVASNPTAARTQIHPDANGTVGLVTAVVASGGTITNGQVSFANSNGISFGVNGSTITASAGPIASYLRFNDNNNGSFGLTATGASNTVQRIFFAGQISATQIALFCLANANSNGSGTMSLGMYTMGGSTANSVSSVTRTMTMASGGAWVTFSFAAWNITPGDYLFAFNYQLAVTLNGVTRRPITNSVPFFGDGICSVPIGSSIHLTAITQSVPNNASSTLYGLPEIIFAGSGTP